jgi:O-antigen/teichoic acid export membrane protein
MRELISGVIKTSSSVFINLIFGAATTKIMALTLGTEGIGLFSLMRQIVLTFGVIAQGNQTAIVQGIASRRGFPQSTFIRSAFYFFLPFVFLSVLAIESLSMPIANVLFQDQSSEKLALVRWMAIPVILQYAYIFLKSILNGFRAIGTLAIIEILGPVTTFLLAYPMCKLVNSGYLMAFIVILSAGQIVILITTLYVLIKKRWLSIKLIFHKIQILKSDYQYLIAISGTTLITAIFASIVLFIVRFAVTKNSGLEGAGYFDLAWTLSGGYVMVILGSFGTYYMPTLSQTKGIEQKNNLIKNIIRLAILLMTPIITAVIVLKPALISILYSVEFMDALKIMRWMLIGDYLKITCWILVIPLLVNMRTKIYLWTEIFWYGSFLGLSLISTYYFNNLEYIGASFMLIYLLVAYFFYKKIIKIYGLHVGSDLMKPWILGLFFIVCISMICWNDSEVRPYFSSFSILLSATLSLSFLNKNERILILKYPLKIFQK